MLAGVLILGMIVSVVALNMFRSKKQEGILVNTAKAEIKPIQDNVFASDRVRCAPSRSFTLYRHYSKGTECITRRQGEQGAGTGPT